MDNTIKLSIKKRSLVILLIIYLITALYLLYLSPVCGRAVQHRSLQLVPFRTLFDQFQIRHGFDIFLGNIVGNMAVLFPLGFILALLGWRPGTGKSLILFMATALAVELCQYLLAVGCLDVDDVWMNALGGYLGLRLGSSLVL